MIKRMLLMMAVLTVAAGAPTGVAAQVRFGAQLSWGDDTDLGIGARLEHPWRISATAPLHGAGHFDYFFIDDSPNVDVTYFEVNYNVYYQFRAQALTPYAGGGLGLRYTSVDVATLGSNSETDLGLNLGGGLRFRTAGRLAPFIEGRFTLGGNVEQFILTGGLLF